MLLFALTYAEFIMWYVRERLRWVGFASLVVVALRIPHLRLEVRVAEVRWRLRKTRIVSPRGRPSRDTEQDLPPYSLRGQRHGHIATIVRFEHVWVETDLRFVASRWCRR